MAEIIENDSVESLDQELLTDGTQEAPVEELPEKYRGKTAAEIARMHAEAEKLISRQGQEVSEVRKLADQLIQQNLRTATQQPQPAKVEPELDDVDFFADPKSAVARAVANHPAVRFANDAVIKQGRAEALRNLVSKHPDYKELVADPDYQEWVSKSKVRQQLFQSADRNYDFDAADELFTTYKELKQRREETQTNQVEEVRTAQDKALRAAGNPAVGGSSEPTGKKIYRRADLINLMMRDPARYDSLQPEIMAAYAEGRVR